MTLAQGDDFCASDLQNCKIRNAYCCKPLHLWQYVTEANRKLIHSTKKIRCKKRLPLRETVSGVGTLAGSCWYELMFPEVLESKDHLTRHLKILWELSQDPEKPRGLFLFKVSFLYPARAMAPWESLESHILRDQLIHSPH